MRDTGTLPGVGIVAEHEINGDVDEEDSIVQMVGCSPHASTRRLARRLHIPQTRVWRTLHAEGMYSYHVRRVQHLGPGNLAQRLEFCSWLNSNHRLHRYILFADEVQFNSDGISNTQNSFVWSDENPHATVETNSQLH